MKTTVAERPNKDTTLKNLQTSDKFNINDDQEKELYNEHIKQAVLNRFPQAHTILLCGSQGRALSNGTHLPQKNSDYDFVILYDNFEESIQASMFSCQKLFIPSENRTISMDYKVFDKTSLENHVDETVNIRRFPFLFSMIRDGHIVKGGEKSVTQLKSWAKKIIDQGPAKLNVEQIDAEIEKLRSFINNAQQDSLTERTIKSLALEAANFIPQSILRQKLCWESGTNRVFQYLAETHPLEEQELIDSYESAVKNKDLSKFVQKALSLLGRYENDKNSPNCLLDFNKQQTKIPTELHDIQKQSDLNLCRIMIDQYLDRLDAAYARGQGYELGTQAALWSTLNKASELLHTPGRTDSKVTTCALDFNQDRDGILTNFLNRLVDKDYDTCRDIANAILSPVGGLAFEYLERPYIDDLTKRLALKPNT